ncbi:hypothetical protein BDV33DRAFT_64558 [Aspergillus novoparasiticus]|uniref:Uncharacterized protein n=1 Tax=Aspergillus novoparasiticus TaxID=986946 RepID=A0A5N6EX92_9EURO|nr:hypothetical protein BDV33DRAFT_64558 [Aspergillus novoparasiticus]
MLQDSSNYLVPNMYPVEMEIDDPPDNNHITGSIQVPVQSTPNVSPASSVTQDLLVASLNGHLPSHSIRVTIVHSDSIPEPLKVYLSVVHRL